MRAEVIGVGTEILLGQICNDNAQWISERLAEIGVDVRNHQAVGDNLERIEDIHCDGVGALVVEMTPDSAAQSFVCLTNVDWFSIIIEEGVDAPLMAADLVPVISRGFEECVYFLAYGDDVSGWTEHVSGFVWRWFCS